MAAMRMLRCTMTATRGMTRKWEAHWTGPAMGFFTEMLARPRPDEVERFRNALAFLESLSPADRSDIGIRPADFPRVAREMAGRRSC